MSSRRETPFYEDHAIRMWRWTPDFYDGRPFRLREGGVLRMSITTLYGFADESGDPKSDPLMCMCGFVGLPESWDDFSPRWKTALRRARLKELHATQLLSSNRDARVREFCDAIRETKPPLVAMGVGIDLAHYRKLTTGHQNKVGRPLLVCASGLISLLEKALKSWRSQQRGLAGINLTFDYSQEDSVEILETWIKLKQERRALLDSIKSVAFADDRFFYPVQAADLLANVTMRIWRAGTPDSLAHDYLERLLPRGEDGTPNLLQDFITAQRIDEAVRLHKPLY
jgi:hypothetical protein